MNKYPSVRSNTAPASGVKHAVVTDQSSHSVPDQAPAMSNKNGTQMTVNESLSAVKSNPVQGWVETERGGFEPPTIQALDALKAEIEHLRATRRAVEQDPALSKLVLQWATLPEHVQQTIRLLAQNTSQGGES